MRPAGGGIVRIFHVLVSKNSSSESGEDLEGRRKLCSKEILAQRALVVKLAPLIGALTGTALQ